MVKSTKLHSNQTVTKHIEIMCPNCSQSRELLLDDLIKNDMLSCPKCFIILALITERRNGNE